ncbi:hypothetical protein [Marinobacter mobilis]|uniref:Uncharacterized protein n=1 Tax=Marinobacter mobilis TaxID=488533 RepID=A0A1H2ZBS6_9GAMM|nr:hypothetical protein [Marinobacter mobilis]SDX14786.1 hypothetical protein SAMN04487960_106262 [Marinobacter mobilis]
MSASLNKKVSGWLGASALVVGCWAQAGHLANNTAELNGVEGSGIGGQAMVNFVSGNGSWTAEAQVRGLQPGAYSFAVRLGASAPETVCTFMADGRGSNGCSNTGFDIGGFGEGLILDDNGNVIASGSFDRNGGNRNH